MKRLNSRKGSAKATKFRPIKAWALVAPAHQMAYARVGKGTVFAIYPRRYLAAEAADGDEKYAIEPVEIRSLKRRPR